MANKESCWRRMSKLESLASIIDHKRGQMKTKKIETLRKGG